MLRYRLCEWRLDDFCDAIHEGAILRIQPKAMTVAVILAGLVPIMYGSGAGSEVMQRIAAPMVGGMITAPLLSLFVIPAAWKLLQERKLRDAMKTTSQIRNLAMRASLFRPIAGLGLAIVVLAANAEQQSSGKATDMADMKVDRSQAKSVTSASMADGEVEDVDIESKSIVLKHGPIKSKTIEMEPMTMPFAVTNVKLLSGVKVGDRVKFSAEYINDEFTITSLKIQK
jgi:Cu(I)/Ag(I) efflux system membrane protein CusA/SilA